jgi:hypothetical protein
MSLAESAAVVDKQAQEAIERNKEIAAASQQPVKPFDPVGLDPLSQLPGDEPSSGFMSNNELAKRFKESVERNREIAEKTAALPLSAEEVVSEIKEDAKYVIPMRAIRQIAGHPEPVNPVIYAAAEYTGAQKRVEAAAQTIKRIRIELDAAENEQKEAIEDRNVKKSVLQKLVAE